MNVDNDQLTRRFYETVTPDWLLDKAVPSYTDALLRIIRRHVGTGHKILDICSGYGRLAIPLLRENLDVIGVDISLALLERCAILCAELGIAEKPFSVANMKKLPFPSETFHFCFCVWASFNFLLAEAEQLLTLAEVHRILKTGGKFLIECPFYEEKEPVQHIQSDGASYYYRPVTMSEMKLLAEASGFLKNDVSVETIAGRPRILCLLVR